MPVNPRQGEKEEEFISRCIGEEISSGYEQSQAAAICYSYWRKDKMSKLRTSEERVMAKIKYSRDFKGINLTHFGENSDACWEGYIQVGTKFVDGREVPDCRGPVEMKEGVPHYTKDGVLWEGPTHMGPDGRLMTGEVHTEDSEYLYHKEEFELLPIVDSSYAGEPMSGSKE